MQHLASQKVAGAALGLLAAGLLIMPVPRAARADDDDTVATRTEEDEGVETENIFGFTEGTDTGEKGELELSAGVTGAFKRKREDPESSRYSVLTPEAEIEYGVTDDWKLSLGTSLLFYDIRNIEELDNRDGGGFNSISFESKYRFLNRETSPIGLAFSIEPEISRYDEGSGERATNIELGMKFMADAAIVPDRLFAAVNLAYAPEWAKEDGAWVRESSLEASGALTLAVTPQLFLGAEVRYLASYEGATLDQFEGDALYVGPTLYFQISDRAYFMAAYSLQVAGDSPDNGSHLDLVEHERHQFLAAFGYTF
ncbi:MAG: transporter [Parvibaculaceae bacterium]